MKKALMIASVASMIDQFNIPNIELLQSMGYKVDVIADFKNPGTITHERAVCLKKRLDEMGVRVKSIEIPRILNPIEIIKSYLEVKKIVSGRHYNIVHCHSPIGGAIARIAAHDGQKNGTKVIYTAHGFHFFDGAPIQNWIVFYPIEKMLSKWTDVLITINKEDYDRAMKHFFAKDTVYVPGVGVDTKKFALCTKTKEDKRRELGIHDDAFVLLSVGELQNRKNHRIVIEAIRRLKTLGKANNLIYLLVGKGELESEYRSIIKKYGIENKVWLLGYRMDVDELCRASDVFIHPSIREGFGISPMEAMSSGLPLISANINGIRDYTEEGRTGICINPLSVEEMVDAIEKMNDTGFRTQCSKYNIEKSKSYDITVVEEKMKKVYGET